ncbi:hypothetical protein H4Q26_014473 [Puccinia striiformis f. sp. tritici PST-130]|nr:hypothetical protein H4Q26_014473 [Puccinia striiformis f. sp. tritici PST-130]
MAVRTSCSRQLPATSGDLKDINRSLLSNTPCRIPSRTHNSPLCLFLTTTGGKRKLCFVQRKRKLYLVQRKTLSHSPNILTWFQSVIQVLDIPIIMSNSLRLIALVLLTASWQIAGDEEDPQFGCFKNRDALCSIPTGERDEQALMWAHRRKDGTRDYFCYFGTHPECCKQGQFSAINDAPSKQIIRPIKDTENCKHGGD